MTIKNNYLVLIVVLFSSMWLTAQKSNSKIHTPVFADPFYTGSCDPEIVWNPLAKEWLFFYTGRRPSLGVAATCGNPIGVARSKDFYNWSFQGFCLFDGVGGKPDSEQTFWAPGIIIEGKTAHMFVTYKPDATPPWGTGGSIAHYKTTTDNMVNGWKKVEVVIDEDNCLDACVLKVKKGYRMYYVGGQNKGKKMIKYAESSDLMNWKVIGEVQGDVNMKTVHGYGYQEAVYVFQWKKKFYMITDPHDGLCVYNSEDGISWKYEGQIMGNNSSKRNLDWTKARHPSVVIKSGKAYIFYHVEPFRPDKAKGDLLEIHQRYAFIQMAELQIKDDKLYCKRN